MGLKPSSGVREIQFRELKGRELEIGLSNLRGLQARGERKVEFED